MILKEARRQQSSLPSVLIALDPNADRDGIGSFYCTGLGVEIGAGARPTKVHADANVRYADKRSEDELKTYFSVDDVVRVESIDNLRKQEFDFLIAHHVLEHCVNVIETLIEWIALVRDEGILYLSLPSRDTTPDFLRLHTPPSHFLLDYIYRCSEDDYESRGHIAEFLWSWYDVGGLEGRSKSEAAMSVHQALHAERNDLHWHIFTAETIKFVVTAAAELSGREARLLFLQDGYLRREEHRLVFRIVTPAGAENAFARRILALRDELRESVDRYVLRALNGVVVRSLSPAYRHVPMLVERGSLRPVDDQDILVTSSLAGREPVYFEPGLHRLDEHADAISRCEHRLAPAYARLLHRFVGKQGARLSIKETEGDAPRLRIEFFRDPFLPLMEELEVDLPLVDSEVDVFEWLWANLSRRSLHFIVLDDLLGGLPDLLRTLRIALTSICAGGSLLIGVRDRRGSCLPRRRDSDIGDVVAASEAGLLAPSRAMRFMHYASPLHEEPSEALAAAVKSRNLLPRAVDSVRMSAEDGADRRIECFVFSAASMNRLLNSLSGTRLCDIGRFAILENIQENLDFIVDLAS